MASGQVVIRQSSNILVHLPDFVRHGSKPSREIKKHPELEERIRRHVRTYSEAVRYAPNQVFIGNLKPDTLRTLQQPWFRHLVTNEPCGRYGPFGEIMPQEEFYALLKGATDESSFDLVWLKTDFLEKVVLPAIRGHILCHTADLSEKVRNGKTDEEIRQKIERDQSLPLYHENVLIGCFQRHHDEDESLQAYVLMENLITKASAFLALKHLLHGAQADATDIDFIISCSEEAAGDRYQRGGGNLARAIGEMAGCANATSCDVKSFCVGPHYALLHAAALVKAGLFKKVAVVAGGSLAKLGMKFQGHLEKNMPILEDVAGGVAFLVTEDDGYSPLLRLDLLGKYPIGAGGSQQRIQENLILNPLRSKGLKITDIDRYATELQNPEITLPIGQDDIPLKNYRLIAALAVQQKEIDRSQMNEFIEKRGLVGFAPTQGHIPAGVPYIAHGIREILEGKENRIMIVAKGSPFLTRMTNLSDGLSFVLGKNPKQAEEERHA
ncbi:MAG TPA: glycine/sarcosine/betaine reductase complex component C subunit beta [Candidatus Deferrimicrobiaceae bacterium]|nr:glycine/sarcosine/betaine reductase complex component C subunit beta [Candidatus Deferrimicrobiaceae bacterium]